MKIMKTLEIRTKIMKVEEMKLEDGKQSRRTAIGPIYAYFYTKASQNTRTKAE
jgi:hypothetical protein